MSNLLIIRWALLDRHFMHLTIIIYVLVSSRSGHVRGVPGLFTYLLLDRLEGGLGVH